MTSSRKKSWSVDSSSKLSGQNEPKEGKKNLLKSKTKDYKGIAL